MQTGSENVETDVVYNSNNNFLSLHETLQNRSCLDREDTVLYNTGGSHWHSFIHLTLHSHRPVHLNTISTFLGSIQPCCIYCLNKLCYASCNGTKSGNFIMMSHNTNSTTYSLVLTYAMWGNKNGPRLSRLTAGYSTHYTTSPPTEELFHHPPRCRG